MSTDADKALVRRYYEEVLTKRDPDLVDELFSPSYVYHYADTPPGLATDREGLKQFVTHFLVGYPDMHFIVEDQTLEGDQVVTHLTARSGLPVGPVMTIPADFSKGCWIRYHQRDQQRSYRQRQNRRKLVPIRYPRSSASSRRTSIDLSTFFP